jgi:hypothetical protein
VGNMYEPLAIALELPLDERNDATGTVLWLSTPFRASAVPGNAYEGAGTDDAAWRARLLIT